MVRKHVLVSAVAAVGVGLTTFLWLAASPRWYVMWLGPYEILVKKEDLLTWLQKDRVLTPEERVIGGYAGMVEHNVAETWRVAGAALVTGLGVLPAYVVLRWYWSLVRPIARPW